MKDKRTHGINVGPWIEISSFKGAVASLFENKERFLNAVA